MGGSTKSTQTSESQTETNPWEKTIGPLGNIIGQLNRQIPKAGLNQSENSALGMLSANAQQGNPYAPQIGMLANELLSGGQDRTGMVSGAYDSLKTSLQPFASGQYVDPASNPALRGYLDVARNDATNAIRSQFAAAGRDFSGAEVNTLGRGITAAEAPILANAYENERSRQMGAIGSLYSGGVGAAQALSGLDQTALGNKQAGIGASSSALQARDSGANQILAIEAQRRGIPMQNLGMLSNMLIPMAGLGGTSNSTQTTTSEQEQPLGQQILGGAIGGAGLLGQMGAFGPTGWLLSGAGAGAGAAGAGAGAAGGLSSMLPFLAMMSDRKLKKDIAQVGQLFDGTPVYRYRLIGNPAMQIGLMADEIERFAPHAVSDVGDYKAVNYELATDRAMRAA